MARPKTQRASKRAGLMSAPRTAAAAAAAVLLGAASVSASLAADSKLAVRGVAPQDASKYLPKAGTTDQWQCLTSGEVIAHSAINDDYCDCADGSDEPGTSACAGFNSTTRFYCANEGHLPAYILPSRVNDGICDPACCDGSDEYDGRVSCPNTCAKVGKEYRTRVAQAENTRRAGSKIRAKYISDAKKKIQGLKAEAAKLTEALGKARELEAKAKASFEYAESADRETVERKKAMPLYSTLAEHQSAIRALSQRNSELEHELRVLTYLLDDLASGYNPNYQDMAVKGAVMAYAKWRRDQTDTGDGEDEAAEGHAGELANEPATRLDRLSDPGEWDPTRLDLLAGQDILELMDGIDAGQKSGQDSGLLFRIHEYLPDSVTPYFEAFVDTLLDLLLKANIISSVKRVRPSSGGTPDAVPENVTRAREAWNKASGEVRRLERELRSAEGSTSLEPEKYGREGEFKALEGTCLERQVAEYTYEFCFGGRVTQKARNGGHTSLGTFRRFNPKENLTPDQDAYYSTAIYDRGQQCWNGPQRSALVDLVCDTKNELLDVFEAEKCTYSVKVSTPAVCFPLVTTASGTDPAAAGQAPHQEL